MTGGACPTWRTDAGITRVFLQVDTGCRRMAWLKVAGREGAVAVDARVVGGTLTRKCGADILTHGPILAWLGLAGNLGYLTAAACWNNSESFILQHTLGKRQTGVISASNIYILLLLSLETEAIQIQRLLFSVCWTNSIDKVADTSSRHFLFVACLLNIQHATLSYGQIC